MHGYRVTKFDRLAMIEICNRAWNVNFKGSRDKAVPSYTQRDGTVVEGLPPYTRWVIQAVNPHNNTYYTTDGESIKEAVDNWFAKIEEVNGKKEDREVYCSLWDAKLDLIKEGEEAQE